MKTKILAVLAATLVPALTLVGAPPASAATWSSPDGSLTVVEANIGSGAECGGTAVGEDCLAVLKGMVRDYEPDVIYGEEFCEADYLAFKQWLQEQNPSWEVYYSARVFQQKNLSKDPLPDDPTNGRGCPDPNDPTRYLSKGQVLAGLDLYSKQEVPLATATTTEQYLMTCANNAAVGPHVPTRFCVTHLATGHRDPGSAGDQLNLTQLKAIQADQEEYARPAIGGDFNLATKDDRYLRYLDDDLGSGGPGTHKMMDPDDISHVDHTTFRRKSGMKWQAMSVRPGKGWGDVDLSSHDFRVAWVRYE